MALTDAVRWSGCEFPLSEFVGKHDRSLPAIIRTTSGFSGGDDEHNISIGETFWVYGIKHQKRVVAKAINTKLYSIPVNYPLKFHLVSSGKKGSAARLKELLATAAAEIGRTTPPCVILEDEERALFVAGDETGARVKFGCLKLIDTYDEVFLRAHTISNNKVISDEILLPTYLPVKIDIVVGLQNSEDREDYDRWLDAQIEKVQALPLKSSKVCGEIIMLRQRASTSKTEDKIYEHLASVVCVPTPPNIYEQMATVGQPQKHQKPTGQTRNNAASSNLSKTMTSPPVVKPKPSFRVQQPADIRASFDGSVLPRPLTTAGVPPRDPQEPPPLPDRSLKNFKRSASETIVPRSFPTPPLGLTRASVSDDPTYVRRPSVETFVPSHPFGSPVPPPPPRAQPKPSIPVPDSAYVQQLPPPPLSTFQTRESPYNSTRVRSVADLPDDISGLSTGDIATCLRALGLDAFVDAFRAADVDGGLLRSLDEQILIDDFAMSKIQARKLMMFAVHGWRPNRAATTLSVSGPGPYGSDQVVSSV